jgi:methionyl-tRNA formyltransferase
MNIVFMGTPEFAIPSLVKIVESAHKVIAVVTAPDKERGRGQKVSFTPIKETALQNNIPLIQPVKLKDPSFAEELKKYPADLFVVVAFRILPKEVFSIPPKGSFNLHASLLPKYRGAAPIQWAIINGEKETGVTTFALAEVVDTGNMYLQKKASIDEDDNFGNLHDKLSLIGADAVLETINMIESNNYELLRQDDSHACGAPKITKETGLIVWDKSAEEIHNLVRGLSPSPGAYFFDKEKLLKVYKTKINTEHMLKPGEIWTDKERLVIGCGKDCIEIFEIQQEGRKRLTTAEFLRGYSFS